MIGTTLPLPLRARPPERMALAFVAPAGLQQFPHPFLRRPTTDCKLFKASPLDPAPPGAVPSRAANAFCPQGGPRRQLISSGGPPPPSFLFPPHAEAFRQVIREDGSLARPSLPHPLHAALATLCGFHGSFSLSLSLWLFIRG